MLALAFLNPALLWFAGLAAIPVIIYLFNRHRHRTMKWAAMDFVLRAVRANQRRLRLESLLLILLRVALVLLLVAALARPVMRSLGPLGDLADQRHHMVIVLDTSYSMGWKEGGQSCFERAQKAAYDLAAATLKQGDRFDILLMSDEPRWLYKDPVFVDDATKGRILRDIQEVEITARPTNAAKTLASIAEYLPRFERSGAGAAPVKTEAAISKQVFVFTDLQKNAFLTEKGLRDQSLHGIASDLERAKADITIVDCGGEDASNVAVTRLEAAQEVAGTDIPVRITASVKNFGPAQASDLLLEFFVDDTLQASPAVSLEAGEEREVERYVTFRDRGAHRVHVVLKSDNLAIDNSRFLALDARDGVDVLLVDGDRKPSGEGGTDFLAAALAPSDDVRTGREYLLRPRATTDPMLSDAELASEPVVVLSDLIALSEEQVKRLESYVYSGGGLLVFLGPQVDPLIWNEKVWKNGNGLLPARLLEVVSGAEEESYYSLEADTFQHPILKPFASKETRTLFGLPRFSGHWRVEWPETAIDDPARACLAWFAPRRPTASGEAVPAGMRREPALIEKRFGRGRVLLFTSSASDDVWNNKFVTQYGYVMLWERAVTYLADSGSVRKNLLVGEPYETVVPSSEYASEILLTTPAQDQIEKTLERKPEEPDRFKLVHNETQKPGVYEIRYHGVSHAGGYGRAARPDGAAKTGEETAEKGERVDYFAVNVDPEEGDLARIDPTELRALLPELKFRVEKEGPHAHAIRAADGKGEPNEVWRYALWSMLLLLPVESFVGFLFGRKAALR